MFDFALMNPPYGRGGGNIHIYFVVKCLQLCDTQIVIMPFSLVSGLDIKRLSKYRQILSPHIRNIEELDTLSFDCCPRYSLAIYDVSRQSIENKTNIQYADGTQLNSCCLAEFRQFSAYEEQFASILREMPRLECYWVGGHSHCTRNTCLKQGITDEEQIQLTINQNIIYNTEKAPRGKIYLTVPNIGFTCDMIYGKYGRIITNYDDLVRYAIENNISGGFFIFCFDTEKAASNCRTALTHNLLLFINKKTKNKIQHGYLYRDYMPDIDWEDERTTTDAGLLELCGCPKDKCQEFADYCERFS